MQGHTQEPWVGYNAGLQSLALSLAFGPKALGFCV